MRTGDLGFQHEGQLYITGRLKDLIILRGRNHYPQDIERTAQEAHVAVDLGAAFTVDRLDLVDRGGGEGERKVDMRAGQPFEQLVVVLQILREHRRVNLDEVLRLIRRAIVEEHELDPHAIVLIRPASLPITSSGKVQRSRCRELFLRDELKVNAQWQQKTISQDFPPQDDDSCRDSLPARPDFFELAQAGDPQRLGLAIESWMLAWLAERANLERTALNSATPFAEVGIDSMTSIELNQELEEALQLKIPPVAAWDHPTPSSLARFLADLYLAGRQGQE
jgi:acyl carrier protein